jgi:signal transduction histidine kinase
MIPRPTRGADADPAIGRWPVARPVAQFLAAGLIAVLIVGVATAAASRRVGQREAIADARSTTLVRAQSLVEPVVEDGLADGDPAAVQAIADAVQRGVIDDSLVRVKIWTGDGRIVYSDVRALEGSVYPLGEEERDALDTGVIEAEVSDLSRPENRYERPFGKLLEVYLPIRTPNGDRLLFEAYYRYDAVSASGRRIWRSFAPIAIGSLIVLELVQLPLAWSLALRLRHRQREREALLQRAVDASDVERRRIAADLHDGVVQDLAGVTFELAGAARERGVPPTAAAALSRASESVRSTVSSLRSMLLDIYPPDLAELGLTAALQNLAADASTDVLDVRTEVRGDVDAVPVPVAQLLYRAAREAVRNVCAHADAAHAQITAGLDGATVSLEVRDDGVGFDPEVVADRLRQGHVGLRGLRDVVRAAGGDLTVTSSAGAGTVVRVEVPHT